MKKNSIGQLLIILVIIILTVVVAVRLFHYEGGHEHHDDHHGHHDDHSDHDDHEEALTPTDHDDHSDHDDHEETVTPTEHDDHGDHDAHSEAVTPTDHDDHDDHDDHVEHSEISENVAGLSGIAVKKAEPGVIVNNLRTSGFITTNPQNEVYLSAKYVSHVEELFVEIGDKVISGQRVAVVENRDTGVRMDITTPISGEVLAISVRPGQMATDDDFIHIVDMSSVWAELYLFNHDMKNIQTGQSVVIHNANKTESYRGEISFISPISSSLSQSRTARIVLDNAHEQWTPGQRVNAIIETQRKDVPLAVERSAVQTIEERPVVFKKEGNQYEAVFVELGLLGEGNVEVRNGLYEGDEYVSQNSFLIKADILKSAAAHDH